MNGKIYQQYAQGRAKKSPLLSDCVHAFLVGGSICMLGEGLRQFYGKIGMTADDAGMLTSVTLIFITALLTGLGVFDDLAKIAGGGENSETPAESAVREISEEGGISDLGLIPLKSMCFIPANSIHPRHRTDWPSDTYVIPEYAFAFLCETDPVLSHEHTECVWLEYAEACRRLTWDSNRTALFELCCILHGTLQ